MAPLSSGIVGSTSTNLIQRAQASEIEAWERLCQLYGPWIYQWARRSGLQEQDASDVMQEVFFALARKLPSFQRRHDAGSFRGWLWTICRRKIVDHFRRIQASPQGAGGTDAYERFQQLPEQVDLSDEQSAVDAQGLRRRAMELISGEFESRTWQAFWRTTIEGAAPADVAHDLGLTVWAIYKARARILQRIREEFAHLLE